MVQKGKGIYYQKMFTMQKNSADLWCTQSNNSKCCVCVCVGGVAVICVRMFIRIHPDRIRMAQVRCDASWVWNESVCLPLPPADEAFLTVHSCLSVQNSPRRCTLYEKSICGQEEVRWEEEACPSC